jgi:iron complex transport system ATP-binding protein
VAGEAGVVRGLRQLLHEHGLDRRSLSAMGYWREGRPEQT